MSKNEKRLSEKKSEKQPGKNSSCECDYLHPEQCEDNQHKANLDATRKEVAKEADKFIEEKSS